MKFIFHIGAGKTGTTSIQKTLRKNDEILKELGVWHLGMMLERSPVKQYDWQLDLSTPTMRKFHTLSEEVAEKQLLDVLIPTIKLAKERKYHTLVWSNESFFSQQYNFVSALKVLAQQGIEIEILVYVREYLSWAQSAYSQWGIKHKTYRGNFQPFSKWIDKRQPSFYYEIDKLMKKYPDVVKVRNMSAVGNVVEDFFTFIDVDSNDIVLFRDNDAPVNEELFFRALYDSKFQREVFIKQFNHAFGDTIPFLKTPELYLSEIFPDTNDMKKLYQDTLHDREQLNEVLIQQGQKPLHDPGFVPRTSQLDTEKLIMALCDMLMTQTKRIDILEKELQKGTE